MSQTSLSDPQARPESGTTPIAAPMAPAKAPVGIGPVPVIGIVLSLVIIAAGVVGIHDALVAAGAVGGDPWIDHLVGMVDGWTSQPWLVPLGIALVLLGLWLLIAAVRPRPRSGFAVRAETGVYLRGADLQRLAVQAATDVDGVLSAKADASRRKVQVRVVATGTSSIGDRVQAAVQAALAPLESQPQVVVKVAGAGGSS